MATDYYAILSLGHDATREEIRDRFLELTRKQHPDLVHGVEKGEAEKAFQAITEAFNVLRDPERRRRHDQEMAQPEPESRGVDSAELTRVYIQRGIKAFREEKNYFSAAENFDRATKEDPQNAQAWHYLALACSHQQQLLGRATRAIAKACEIEPTNGNFHKLAGQLFSQAGMRLRAEKHLRQALEWGGEDQEVLKALKGLQK